MTGSTRSTGPTPGTDPDEPGRARAGAGSSGARRPAVVASAVLVLLLLVAALVRAASAGDGPAGDADGARPTSSGDVVPSESPSMTPTSSPPGPSATSAPSPTAPGGTDSDASGAPAAGAEDPRPFVPETEPAVPLASPAPFGTGVVARLAGLEAVQGVAQGPGEVSGPALRVVVEIVNGTAAPLSLDTAVVELYGGPDEVPGLLLSGSGEGLLSGDLEPGATAAGTYVFRIAPELRDPVRVTVSYSAEAPTVLFEGPAPSL